jgi:transposase InsO family protein
MVTSEEYRHVPTVTLAMLAQRLGKVFASPTTWYRLVRRFQWRRPRTRPHPSGPKVGIRAGQANEIWHVDTTLIRLLDGSRAYLHAIIDNFSRRILAWKVSAQFDPMATAELLVHAAAGLAGQQPTLVADGGVENCNSAVDRLVQSGLLKRLLAQTEIAFSNSLIESWWRALKHQWLYLNSLDTIATLEKLIGFYVDEHNTRLPHSAFRGQTPDEMYFGTGEHVPGELEVARQAATSGAPGDEPQDALSALRAADGARELIIGYPLPVNRRRTRALHRLETVKSTGPAAWGTHRGRKVTATDIPRFGLRRLFCWRGDDPRGKVQISLANTTANLERNAVLVEFILSPLLKLPKRVRVVVRVPINRLQHYLFIDGNDRSLAGGVAYRFLFRQKGTFPQHPEQRQLPRTETILLAVPRKYSLFRRPPFLLSHWRDVRRQLFVQSG